MPNDVFGPESQYKNLSAVLHCIAVRENQRESGMREKTANTGSTQVNDINRKWCQLREPERERERITYNIRQKTEAIKENRISDLYRKN